MNWITFARPFAKRRAVYRHKAELAVDWDHIERLNGYREAVSWAWAQFRDDILTPASQSPHPLTGGVGTSS